MGRWHHRLNGHGFGWTLGVSDGQGGLACCSSWGRRESDTTERLSWTGVLLSPPAFPAGGPQDDIVGTPQGCADSSKFEVEVQVIHHEDTNNLSFWQNVWVSSRSHHHDLTAPFNCGFPVFFQSLPKLSGAVSGSVNTEIIGCSPASLDPFPSIPAACVSSCAHCAVLKPPRAGSGRFTETKKFFRAQLTN